MSIVIKNAFVSVGGTDLSDQVREVTIQEGFESQDPTTMGKNTRLVKAGLKTWNVSIVFKQDFSASEVDAKLSAIYAADPPEADLIIRPDSGAVSATNPQWSGKGVLMDYTPVGAAAGDFLEAPVTFEAAGDLTRATS